MAEEKDIFEDVFGEDKEKTNVGKTGNAEETKQEETEQEEKPVKVFGNPDKVESEETGNKSEEEETRKQ